MVQFLFYVFILETRHSLIVKRTESVPKLRPKHIGCSTCRWLL